METACAICFNNQQLCILYVRVSYGYHCTQGSSLKQCYPVVLYNCEVLCFVCGTHWILKHYFDELRLHRVNSEGRNSCLLIVVAIFWVPYQLPKFLILKVQVRRINTSSMTTLFHAAFSASFQQSFALPVRYMLPKPCPPPPPDLYGVPRYTFASAHLQFGSHTSWKWTGISSYLTLV